MQNEEVIFEDSLHKDNELTAELRKTFPTAVVYFDHCQKRAKVMHSSLKMSIQVSFQIIKKCFFKEIGILKYFYLMKIGVEIKLVKIVR